MFNLLSLISMFAYLLSMFLFDHDRSVRSILIYLYQYISIVPIVVLDGRIEPGFG